MNKILQYVPFTMFNRKTFKNFSYNQKVNNFASSMIGASVLLTYLLSSFSYKAPMFSKKWHENRKEILQQQEHQELTQEKNLYRQEFRELDKNLDGIIDSTEFIYRE